MKIAVLGEKLSLVQCLMPSLAEAYPDAEFVVATSHPIFALNPRFRFPRGLSLKDYPYAGDPVYKPLDPHEWRSPFKLGYMESVDGQWTLLPDWDTKRVLRSFGAADVVIVAPDPWPGSPTAAIHALDVLLPDGHASPRVSALRLMDMSKPAIDLALPQAGPILEVHADLLRIDAPKRRFDFCYAINANVFLKPIQTSIGMASDAAPISKYALQTLYMLRGREPMSEGNVIGAMDRVKGTGRYPKMNFVMGLGSSASRSSIVEFLKDQGLLDVATDGTRSLLSVSRRGLALLDALHPDCEDPDLPFRIRAWGDLPEEESAAKVDRYVRTFFGKMQRYAGRALRDVQVT